MGRSNEEITTKLAMTLVSYAEQTGRADGVSRLERALAEVIDAKIDDDLRQRLEGWPLADLMSLATSLTQLKADAEKAKHVGKSKKAGN